MNSNKTLKQSIFRLAFGTAALLLIPFVAMFFSKDVVWTGSDFVFAGTLLFSTGLTYTFISRQSGNLIYRIATGLALFTALFLVWANLAVGIIGSENNPENAMYFAVVLVLIISSFIARFRPKGMSFALFGTAFAQALTIVIALSTGMQHIPYSSTYEIIMVNGFFITLFSISAGLFWLTAHEDEERISENI